MNFKRESGNLKKNINKKYSNCKKISCNTKSKLNNWMQTRTISKTYKKNIISWKRSWENTRKNWIKKKNRCKNNEINMSKRYRNSMNSDRA